MQIDKSTLRNVFFWNGMESPKVMMSKQSSLGLIFVWGIKDWSEDFRIQFWPLVLKDLTFDSLIPGRLMVDRSIYKRPHVCWSSCGSCSFLCHFLRQDILALQWRNLPSLRGLYRRTPRWVFTARHTKNTSGGGQKGSLIQDLVGWRWRGYVFLYIETTWLGDFL